MGFAAVGLSGSRMLYALATTAFPHPLETVAVCIMLTLAEFLAIALILAPRATTRALLAPLRAVLRLVRRLVGTPSPPRLRAHRSDEGS